MAAVCVGHLRAAGGLRAAAVRAGARPTGPSSINVSGLADGNFVRIAGVEVGKVKNISIRDDNVAVVEFSADDSVVLTQGTRAAIRYENLIGGRYLALEEGAGDVGRLAPGQTIPLSRTRTGVGSRRV